jgi:VWFA-related protein
MRHLATPACAALIAALFGISTAQEITTPVFHAGAHLVEITVTVRERTGQAPAANLTKDDFIVSEGSKHHTVSVFTAVAGQAAKSTLPPNVFSNRIAAASLARPTRASTPPNSLTIILIDRLNTLAGTGSQPYEENSTWREDGALATAREQLMKFVNTLDPQSLVAIYSLGKTLTVLSDFTGDRDQLRAALEKDRANTSIYRREDVDPHSVHTPAPDKRFDASINQDRLAMASYMNRDRAQISIAALTSIASHVAGISGRKNLIWLTANLPFPVETAARALSRANVAAYPMDARGLLTSDSFGRNNDSVLDPTVGAVGTSKRGSRGAGAGQIAQGTRPMGDSTMEVLALETGGRAFINANDLAGGMRQIVEDDSRAYKLGFYLDSESLDSKFHKLEIRVKHGKFEVRAPSGYFAAQDQSVTDHDRLMEAIVTPLESSAIGLTARVERVSQPQPGSLAISGAINLADLKLEQKPGAWKGAFEVYVIEQDVTGGPLGQLHRRYNLQLTPQMREDYLKTGVQFHEILNGRDGLSTLRLLVLDPNGSNIGSLIIPAEKFRN